MTMPRCFIKSFANITFITTIALTGCSTLTGKKPRAERLDFDSAPSQIRSEMMAPPYVAGREIVPRLESPVIADVQRTSKTSAEVLAEEQEKEGIPVRPGFVKSPYAPNAGLVNVEGYPAGLRVKDPYTGRVMKVPETPTPQDPGSAGQADVSAQLPNAGKRPIQDIQPPQASGRRTY